MRRILFFFCAVLFSLSGRGEIVQPKLTTDDATPTYYTIKSYRSGKYAAYVGASKQLRQSETVLASTLWLFKENGDGVSIVPAVAPTLKMASNQEATEEGRIYYLKESSFAGCYCISTTSASVVDGNNSAADCWDANNAAPTIGIWKNIEGDNQGTSWIIEETDFTYAQVQEQIELDRMAVSLPTQSFIRIGEAVTNEMEKLLSTTKGLAILCCALPSIRPLILCKMSIPKPRNSIWCVL